MEQNILFALKCEQDSVVFACVDVYICIKLDMMDVTLRIDGWWCLNAMR